MIKCSKDEGEGEFDQAARGKEDLPLPPGCVVRCPGCAHRTWSAAASVAQKHGWLQRILSPWAERVQSVRTVDEAARWGYRRKVCLSARLDAETGWQFGLWRRGELIPIPDCPVHAEAVRCTLHWMQRTLPRTQDFPLAFFVQAGAQVTLIVKARQLPPSLSERDSLPYQELEERGVEGLWMHLHPAAGRRLFARSGWVLLWGQSRSRDAQGLWYGPTAFQQQIPALYHLALDAAENFLQPEPGDALIDLYCGLGASLVRWMRQGVSPLGVELSGEAVECAQVNAPAATILRGKCADRLPQLRSWMPKTGRRLLYVNPPRTGLEPEVREWIVQEFRPERLAYLSCSAGTFSRDLAALTAEGYTVAEVIPYDFFPQTHHLEVLGLLVAVR